MNPITMPLETLKITGEKDIEMPTLSAWPIKYGSDSSSTWATTLELCLGLFLLNPTHAVIFVHACNILYFNWLGSISQNIYKQY